MSKNHEYREGEIVRARGSWTVVAILQHYHGGWDDMMKAVSVMSQDMWPNLINSAKLNISIKTREGRNTCTILKQ